MYDEQTTEHPEVLDISKTKEFINRHRVKILVGASVLLYLKNRGLKRSNRSLQKEIKELTEWSEFLANQNALAFRDLIFGPRY